MRKVFTKIFAIIGFIVTLLIVLGIVVGLYVGNENEKEPDNAVLALDFSKSIVEQNDSSPLQLALQMTDESTTLFDVVRAIDKAKSDDHVKGIVARFGSEQPSLAQSQEIRAALARFRESGKFTYAYGASYGNFGDSNRSYYLASAFENIWLQPVGSVSLTGIAIEAPFAKDALDKIGVAGDFMQREEYKSFMETFTREQFSPLVHVEMQAMIEDLADQLATGIAESRKWDVSHVKDLMNGGPYLDDEALKEGLVTHIGYNDELDDEIKQKAGANVEQVSVDDYVSYSSKTKSEAVPTHVALIYGTGLISDASDKTGNLSGDHVMSANEIANAFNDAANDKTIKAIIFRVDSPGGSPEASETIRHALMHAKAKGKIVIVSMGEVATSGGYWVAMNADKIIAEPGTLTGSIGVVGGKFVVSGLAQKLGVTFDTMKTSENAGMWSMNQSFSPEQREHVNALLDQTYHAFVYNVAEARKIPLEKMPDIAKGRVWVGDQAVKLGLVDELGGYDVAIGSVRKALNMTLDDPISLDEFPAPLTPAERIMKLLKGMGAESSMIGLALSQWQGLNAMLKPFLAYVTVYNHSVSVHLSPEVSTMVH